MNGARGGATTMAASHTPWGTQSSYKIPTTPSLTLTPPPEGSISPFRISPWSRISEIHVSLWLFLEGFVASVALLERGRGGCRDTRTCVRSWMHHCFAVLDLMVLDLLDRMDFITTL